MKRAIWIVPWFSTVVLGVSTLTLLHYARSVHGWERSRWESDRCRVLERVGERLRTYAEQRAGNLPSDVEALIRAGVVARSELDFTDMNAQTRVRRAFRLVPTIALPGELIIVVETYDRYPDLKLCLRLDGSVIIFGKGDTLDEDDRRREDLGLNKASPMTDVGASRWNGDASRGLDVRRRGREHFFVSRLLARRP